MHVYQVILCYTLNLYKAVCKLFLKTGRKGNTYKNHTITSDRHASHKNTLIYSGTITWLKNSQPRLYVHIHTPHVCSHSTHSDIILIHPQHKLHTHPNTLTTYTHIMQRYRHTKAHSYHTHREMPFCLEQRLQHVPPTQA